MPSFQQKIYKAFQQIGKYGPFTGKKPTETMLE